MQNDPALVEILDGEDYDVNAAMEFQIAEEANHKVVPRRRPPIDTFHDNICCMEAR